MKPIAGLLVIATPLSKLKLQLNWNEISRHVQDFLYIYLSPGSELSKLSFGTSSEQFFVKVPFSHFIRQYVQGIYRQSSSQCLSLEVKVILENITQNPMGLQLIPLRLMAPISKIISDVPLTDTQRQVLGEICRDKFGAEPDATLHCINAFLETDEQALVSDQGQGHAYDHVCVGGTFDGIHTGHKILLSETCLLAEKCVTVGIATGPLLNKKILSELIRPVEDRVNLVKHFLSEVRPQCRQIIVPITEPLGPAATDQTIQAIVISEETTRGEQLIRDKRRQNGLPPLDVYMIELLHDNCHSVYEEEKISSSSLRKRMLGQLLQPSNTLPMVHGQSYILGVTGGIACGKSSVCKRLAQLGAATVDCDKLGHAAYRKGTKAYEDILQVFGKQVLHSDGEVNRQVLGPIVFSDKEKMQQLNKIVWPAIMDLAQKEIENYSLQGFKVMVLEAAILFEAGWDKIVHEVWCCIVPPDEVVKRLTSERNVTEDQARQRLSTQLSNNERVARSHVVLCTLWEPEYTQQQVEKAWKLLQKRIQRHLYQGSE